MDVIHLYDQVIRQLPAAGYSGIYVVYDEFSKYLESSIQKASISDIKMLQDFAEKCNRSGEAQMHLLLISHKELENYIDTLPKEKVDGWRGVSERFRHITMESDYTQTYDLIAHAIEKTDTGWEPFRADYAAAFDRLTAQTTEQHLLPDCPADRLRATLEGCYPLHPLTIFLLPRLSEKIAQNERTLFTFLCGKERGSLLPVCGEWDEHTFPLVTPDALYDYFAPLMRRDVYTSNIHKTYELCEKALQRLGEDVLGQKLIKTLAVLYCVDQFDKVPPMVDTLISVFASDELTPQQITDQVKVLEEKQCVVYRKRSNAYLELKESSGVDIFRKVTDEITKQGTKADQTTLLDKSNLERYLYPIRYNDEYAMTRYFRFRFLDGNQFAKNPAACERLLHEEKADGVVFGIVPQDDIQNEVLQSRIQETAGIQRALFVFPAEVKNVKESLQILKAATALRDATDGDALLYDEYDMMVQDHTEVVQQFIRQYTHPERHAATYYYRGAQQPVYRKSLLNHLLSDICAEVFPNTPVINNEVLNQDHLSAIAQKSRTRLVSAILEQQKKENLGLIGSGQEVSFLRSALVQKGLLNQQDQIVTLQQRSNDENLTAVLQEIAQFFEQAAQGQKRSFSELYQTLCGAEHGIGMRRGAIPIYLALVIAPHQKDFILRDQNKEVALTPELLSQINEAPQDYTVTVECWGDDKQGYIEGLEALFGDYVNYSERSMTNYSYLASAINRWYLSLPKYAKELRTIYHGAAQHGERVPSTFQSVLRGLKSSGIGPQDLLFDRLPHTFGHEHPTRATAARIAEAKQFYDEVLPRLKEALLQDAKNLFQTNGGNLLSGMKDWYDSLSERTKAKLYPNQADRLFTLLRQSSYDEGLFLEQLAKELTSLRLEDWNEKKPAEWFQRLTEFKETIDAEEANQAQRPQEAAAVQPARADGYTVVFVDEDGTAQEKHFPRERCSQRGELLYRRMNNALKDMGNSLSVQEKRQILMNLLQELC